MSAVCAGRSRAVVLPWLGLLAGCALLLPSCETDGNFTILGYTTKPNYDCTIHTIRVPIFKNLTLRDEVRQGLEMELTRAVVRKIELKTPYKVVGEGCTADTELIGTIVSYNKGILNRNPLNEVREAEMTLTVEITWRDLRPGREGEVLSRPARAPGTPIPPPPPNLPPGAPWPPSPPPVLVQSIATFVPELGESFSSARQKNVDRLAVQVVSMMETPW